MILLPRRSLTAIAAVVDVALHARPSPVSAKALAARHHLPARHLEPVLQALVRGGVLKGMRGPRGGYELARERRRVSVADIVRMTQRPADDASGPRSGLLAEVIEPTLVEAGEAYLRQLETITVEDLCASVLQRSDGARQTDFTI